jgi:hypothetical protein
MRIPATITATVLPIPRGYRPAAEGYGDHPGTDPIKPGKPMDLPE